MTTFDALRATGVAGEPDRRFVDRLRADLLAALSPTVTHPDRSTTVRIPTATDTPPEPAPSTTRGGLVPYIAVRGAAAAIDWYGRVFGARELTRYTADDGVIGHAEIAIGSARLMLSDEHLEFGAASPEHLGGTSVALNLEVPDVDAVFRRAVAEGATVRREPADQPYGDRSCQFLDPWGHRWMVQTTIASPTLDELNARMEGFTVTATDESTD